MILIVQSKHSIIIEWEVFNASLTASHLSYEICSTKIVIARLTLQQETIYRAHLSHLFCKSLHLIYFKVGELDREHWKCQISRDAQPTSSDEAFGLTGSPALSLP
jgi:hypothetical protein